MEEAIKLTVKTKGWQYIVGLFNEQIDYSRKNISAEGDREIAVQYLGRLEAEKIINGVLKRIEQMCVDTNVKPITYK